MNTFLRCIIISIASMPLLLIGAPKTKKKAASKTSKVSSSQVTKGASTSTPASQVSTSGSQTSSQPHVQMSPITGASSTTPSRAKSRRVPKERGTPPKGPHLVGSNNPYVDPYKGLNKYQRRLAKRAKRRAAMASLARESKASVK